MTSRTVDVLVVEDHPFDAELTMKALHRVAPSIKTALVTTGAAALEYLQTQRPKVVLLDMKLPDLDGLQILRNIRANPTTRTLPVIILTGALIDRHQPEARGLNVNAYITKSADVGILSEHLAVFQYLLSPASALSGQTELNGGGLKKTP